MQITANDTLTNLSGLDNLTSIGGDLRINSNDGLTSLNGLSDSLTSIGGTLQIFNNDSLTSLSGLENLNSIEGWLQIIDNDALTSLSGLDSLDHTTLQHLRIEDNPNLSFCEIQPVCDFLENDGPATINGNAPGCNSETEVEAACLAVPTEEVFSAIDAISLFPNPTIDIVYIEGTEQGRWNVHVMNALGVIVKSQVQIGNGQVDLSDLPNGLYFLEFQSDNHSVVKRVIKE